MNFGHRNKTSPIATIPPSTPATLKGRMAVNFAISNLGTTYLKELSFECIPLQDLTLKRKSTNAIIHHNAHANPAGDCITTPKHIPYTDNTLKPTAGPANSMRNAGGGRCYLASGEKIKSNQIKMRDKSKIKCPASQIIKFGPLSTATYSPG